MSVLRKIVSKTMNSEKIKLNLLKTNLNNVKTHNKKNIDAIKKSLKKFGQYTPLVVNKNNFEILKGVGTYMAMKQLNYQQCQVYFVNLNENQENQLIVLDNRTSQLSQIDTQMIEKMFYDLKEEQIKITGYNQKEVDKIMNEISIKEKDDQTQKANIVKIKCPYCGKYFSEE